MIEVKRKDNETPSSAIRRFVRKVQQSGNLIRVRSLRFKERSKSQFTKKKEALRRIDRAKIRQRLYKLGKLEIKKRR